MMSQEIGSPGQFPYTRGIHPHMYRKKLWTMRQVSGFATPEATNSRYRHLIDHGQTGLSVAFDLPTLMGYDADAAAAEGEVGRCGVSVCCLDDMEALLRGIPLGEVSMAMTINSPAVVLWAMYLVSAEKQGIAWDWLSGTLQNDILKEYIAQKEFIFPPRPSMRLVTDIIEFAVQYTPRFNPISVSGYHIREAGATALQELAFTLRDGLEYVEWALARGLEIDQVAPRMSFFFSAHNNFFEEIAKFRAARKLWANLMRDRFGAKQERSLKLRFHAQTAGSSLSRQQPYNNIARTAFQALAAVLGGTQSLHTNALDEAHALPDARAAILALRTQQVIAYETGVAATPDPLGGSYLLEQLTCELEDRARQYIRRIDDMGGMLCAIEAGFPQMEIAESSYQYQRAIEAGEKIIVGVNAFHAETESPGTVSSDESVEPRQKQKLAHLKSQRDHSRVQKTLDAIKRAAEGTGNTMPSILGAVRAGSTLGEICDALRCVFGSHEETVHI